jgi:hypothetical protein
MEAECFEASLRFLHENVNWGPGSLQKRTETHPYCNCPGAYSFNGKNITVASTMGEGLDNITKCSNGDTCDFCDHYVSWQEQGTIRKISRKRKGK